MRIHTEIRVSCKIRRDTPPNIIKILNYLVRDAARGAPKGDVPEHPFFETEGWRYICTMAGSNFKDEPQQAFVRIGDQWHLLFVANLKNYNGEVEKFFDWLNPYIDASAGDIIGYHRNEEYDDETPVVRV